MGRPLQLLLTSVGGPGVPALIDSLRQQPDFDLTVTGVDASSGGAGAYFVDRFVHVPHAEAPEYVDVMLGICRTAGIELVIPQSDAEAVRLSGAEDQFARIGCLVLASCAETTRVAVDKFECLSRLRDSGVPVPRFHRPRNLDDVDAALADLGFPTEPVVLKPLASSGSRGFRVITAESEELGDLLAGRRETSLSVDRLRDMLGRTQAFPEFLLMEYLAGAAFSVDVLVRCGRAAAVVPHRRLSPAIGPADETVIEPNTEIEVLVQKILAVMPWRYVINIDMASRRAGGQDGILPFDLNPRPSALIAATSAARCSFLVDAMREALGLESRDQPIQRMRMIRYWKEHYASIGTSAAEAES